MASLTRDVMKWRCTKQCMHEKLTLRVICRNFEYVKCPMFLFNNNKLLHVGYFQTCELICSPVLCLVA